MSNSKWKPYSEIPSNGVFLVWAPDLPDGRKPYLGSNLAISKRTLTKAGNGAKLINGNFHFDVATPTLYAEIDTLIEDLPLGCEG